ncbi:MAG TPA: tetratricopeptide repeat protein, partial [Thermoanaerobaculia bacterium]|nr:tetratricopeptide repeat protein [Thermoanaerobaculia bacterium]
VEAVCELAQLNLQIQQLDRARPLLEKCQQLQPGDSNTLLALANLYFDTKEWALARDRYQEYLKTDPGNPDVRTDLGVSFLNLGDSKQALQIFEQVQSEHADHWASLYNQVVVLAFHLHDMPAARAALERLRKLAPSGNQDLDRLAAEMDKLGRAAT